ncbi:MAG: right-handed parallel beta-helix repeat-containing protein [Deltaproteobacteria bacterium]|nr:right-handed parallel beta-helix repeat-containing protein [Deltaproteobacteria bacterium]
MKRHLFLTVTLVMFFSLVVNAFAATYYVKPDGNNKLDGRSDAKAWKTIGKVNSHSFVTGDDVYFKCGGTWTGSQLWVDWSGNSGNKAVIGAYYMDGGAETIGVSGNKPVIDGNNTVPSGDYTGLIHVQKRDYVTVKNIKVVNSAWDGVRFQGSSSNNNATNIETGGIYKVGVKYQYVTTGVVEGCDITDSGRTALYGGDWPAVLAITTSDSITIRKNVVHENYGEGIGIYKHSDNCIVEDNVCYANAKAQIYIGLSRGNIIRRNLCYGTTDKTFWRGSVPGLGIGVSDEPWMSPYSENNKIYNNLVAYCSKGIFLWCGDSPDWPLKDTDVYNNVVVDCGTNLHLSRSRTAYENSHVKNNIFWSISGDSIQASVPSNHSGLTLDYNLWSSTSDTDAQGPHDPPYATPMLNKTTGWRSMIGGDLNGSNFALRSASPAIDAGIPLGAEFDDIPECDKSVWPAQIVLMDQDNQGSMWEIGADIHVVNPTVLDAPTGLKIAAGQ